jgi:HEAT repeat protein
MVGLLKRASDDAERRAARLALLAVCSRGREACAGAIIDGLADADAASRIALIQALARAGGEKALQTIAEHLDDQDEAVRDEAVRMLSYWPTAAAAPHLKTLAKGDDLRHQVLAIRGLVRLAGPREDKPADVTALAEAMNLAHRPDEKRLVLGVLGGVPTADSLALVAPLLDDPQLAEEASLAAVLIAEQMGSDNRDQVRAALEKVLKVTHNGPIRERAQNVLKKS